MPIECKYRHGNSCLSISLESACTRQMSNSIEAKSYIRHINEINGIGALGKTTVVNKKEHLNCYNTRGHISFENVN